MAVEINVRTPAWRRFHTLVEERDRQRMAEARRQAARGWLGWLWRAAAERRARRGYQLQQEAGLKGERQVGAALRLLPDDWFVLNGLVVEVREGEYQEIDHVAVGPSGLVVVETKAWGGVLDGG
ncbi:MAG: NERD domain-containing protein, partial [Clostridia bacterium]|nr:NERD domain-containing protein [Clostridia bacterium]